MVKGSAAKGNAQHLEPRFVPLAIVQTTPERVRSSLRVPRMDKEEVGHTFENYNLISAGVVNKNNNEIHNQAPLFHVQYYGKLGRNILHPRPSHQSN